MKGYEVARDQFVVLAPEEVAALRPRTSTELEITEFVSAEEIDPVYYETSYYVMPEAGGEKAYTLLFAALKETGHAGIGSLAMHGREHVALIRAVGRLLCCTRCSIRMKWAARFSGGVRGRKCKGVGTGENACKRPGGEV
jgi:DNA end-binding protein Ku